MPARTRRPTDTGGFLVGTVCGLTLLFLFFMITQLIMQMLHHRDITRAVMGSSYYPSKYNDPLYWFEPMIYRSNILTGQTELVPQYLYRPFVPGKENGLAEYDSIEEKLVEEFDQKRINEGARFINDPLNDCLDPCIVKYNPGGRQISFLYAARTLPKRRNHGAVFDGPCYSGCASFAVYGRLHAPVCVTKRATFHFHGSSLGDMPTLPDDVFAWVEEHGGFPPHADQTFTVMGYPDTMKFFKLCTRQEYRG